MSHLDNRLVANKVDFSTTDTLPTPQELLQTPDLVVLPTAAIPIVPVLNIPGRAISVSHSSSSHIGWYLAHLE
jgi:ABC-type phosphate transport system substrate-binding protein